MVCTGTQRYSASSYAIAGHLARIGINSAHPTHLVDRHRADSLVRIVEEVREQDHVFVVDEFEAGLTGVGVPARTGGALVAMIAIYLPTTRFTPDSRRLLLDELSDASALLARQARPDALRHAGAYGPS